MSSNGFGQILTKTNRGFQYLYKPFLPFPQVSRCDSASAVFILISRTNDSEFCSALGFIAFLLPCKLLEPKTSLILICHLSTFLGTGTPLFEAALLAIQQTIVEHTGTGDTTPPVLFLAGKHPGTI
jgi:hypothetical protein